MEGFKVKSEYVTDLFWNSKYHSNNSVCWKFLKNILNQKILLIELFIKYFEFKLWFFKCILTYIRSATAIGTLPHYFYYHITIESVEERQEFYHKFLCLPDVCFSYETSRSKVGEIYWIFLKKMLQESSYCLELSIILDLESSVYLFVFLKTILKSHVDLFVFLKNILESRVDLFVFFGTILEYRVVLFVFVEKVFL